MSAGALAGCGAAGLLACAVLSGMAGLEHARAARELEQARQRLSVAERSLRTRRAREWERRTARPRYLALRRRHFIGSQPPDWVESLERLRAAVPLPDLRLHLSAPKPAGETRAGHRLHAGSLDLDLELRHTGELLDLLDRLPLYFKALARPESCRVERAGQDAGTPLLHARCRVRWYTLQDERQAGSWLRR